MRTGTGLLLRAHRRVEKELVLIGAGHAHVQVLKRFGMAPVEGLRVTLITREVHAPYSGMLPGFIAGHYSYDEAHIDTAPLCQFAGARLYHGAATGLDLDAKRVICEDRAPVPYDLLSINTGSAPNVGHAPDGAPQPISVKPIDRFLAQFGGLRARVLASKAECSVAVVGGGAGGVELMLALAFRLRNEAMAAGYSPERLRFTLVTATPDILPGFPVSFRRHAVNALLRHGIRIVRKVRVTGTGARGLLCDDGAVLRADEVLWATEASPPHWLQGAGLTLDEDGFVAVDANLRALGHDDVFAAGDIAAFEPRALPKSGVYAVRAGAVLAENLQRAALGRELKRYRPQRRALYLLTTGEKSAIGTRNGLTFAGPWVWRLKDRIDRDFMARFNDLPAMPAVSGSLGFASGEAMRCGGCGAKVGPAILAGALSGIDPYKRPEIVAGLDLRDDAAILDMGGPKLSVQTVDYFRAFIDDPYLFGRIAANHALGDIYAMGGRPLTALAIPTLPFDTVRAVAADLSALMQGANETLRAASCALIGGHTGEGAELALGFAMSGEVDRDRVLRKSGAKPGDTLVLTKALGTGTILAAHMLGHAKGRWLTGALDAMLVSNARAAEIVSKHGAHATTDVTGFGLAGHLLEMLRASGADAVVEVDRLPALDGALAALREGHASSLQPQNKAAASSMPGAGQLAGSPHYELLFDPQTAGGLLAAVPGAAQQACIAELHEAGYGHAACIGTVRKQAGNAPLIMFG